MPLQLNGQDIETLTGDTGTYTWADVVALGSTNLTTLSTAGGRNFYRLTGTLTLRGTSTLNITNETIELLDGKFRANESSKINIGIASVVSGQNAYSGGCQLLISTNNNAGSDGAASASQLTYTTGDDRSSTTSAINIYNSVVSFKAGANRSNIFVSKIYNSLFYDDTTDTGSLGCFVFLQGGGVLANTKFTRLSIELAGSNISVQTFETVLPKYAFLNYTGARQSFSGVVSLTATDYDFYVQDNSPLDFIDSIVDLTNGHIQKFPASALLQSRRLASQFLKIQSGGVAIEGAYVAYAGRTSFNDVTNGSGLFSVNLVWQETNLSGDPGNFNFFSEPTPITDYSTYSREVRSYLHQAESESLTINSALGTASQPFIFTLIVDTGVTVTNTATVGAYSGIANATNLITLTGSLSLAQVYDSRKLYWRNTDGITAPFRSGQLANFNSTNITIDSGGVITASTTKFSDGIKSNGTITLLAPTSLTTFLQTDSGSVVLQATGNYSAISARIGATATVTVATGSTNLQGWTFAAGATINVSSSTATVTVDSISGITAGAGVTLQTPVSSIAISGIPTGANAILGVIDLTTMVQTFPTITGSTATIVTDPARSYFVACDARGYLRQTVTLAGNTPAFTFNLTNFRALYESGVPGADITLNTSTFVVTVGDSIPLLTLATVFRAIEDLLATPEAVFFSTPPYPVIVSTGTGAARQYLFFPYDTPAGTPNPVRIKPKTTNTIDPTLTDFVVVHEGSTAPLFSIFDFTSAGGRTIRFQTEAVAASVVVSGSGALTTDQANQLAALNATLQSSGVFSTAALANAPSGGSGGLDAAGVRSAIGLAAANLDTQLTGINTNVDQIPLADNTTAITAIKAKTDQLAFTTANRVDSTAIAVTDKTGYSLSNAQTFNLTGNISGSVGSVTGAIVLPTIPTNWLTASGLSSDAVTEIQAGLSTYAGGDTTGTTTLLSRLTSGRATNLDRLDDTITSRQATFAYTAPDNAGITAIKAKTDNLPPSPAATGDVQVTVSGGFTGDDRTALNNIPTTAYTTTLSTILSAVQGIPTTPLLTGDSRLNFLNASIAAIPTDKAGYALTGGERTAIAVAVETQLTAEFEALPTAVEIRQELEASTVLAKEQTAKAAKNAAIAGL